MSTKQSDHFPRLFLIRHGSTDWTDSHQHTGRTDIPLNAKGEKCAKLLGSRLKGRQFSRVFVSPLMRVRRTCELAGFSQQAEVNPDLIEWSYGDYEGITTSQVHLTRPDWFLYRDGAPNGESPEQVAARVDRFLDLVRPLDGDVAAFSSGQTIRVIAARWLGLPPLAAQYFQTETASIGILSYEHNRGQSCIQLWDDVGTLDIHN